MKRNNVPQPSVSALRLQAVRDVDAERNRRWEHSSRAVAAAGRHIPHNLVRYTIPTVTKKIVRRKRCRQRMAVSRRETLRQMNDEDLMVQFQEGMVDAFNILFERYSDRLVRFLYGYLGDAQL